MNRPIIDAHIHFDCYSHEEQQCLLNDLEKYHVDALISVSNNLSSAQKNLALSKKDSRIKLAFGFHPEQPLPDDEEIAALFDFIEENKNEMIAIGEVGLPYYERLKDPSIKLESYLELLEEFLKLAVKLDKPVALHAIYEDAPIVINLLEKYSIKKAHFHWFKGDAKTLEQMATNGYFISFTPDLLYKYKIQQIASTFPLSQIMVETDGPWPFDGPFQNKLTHPKMIHETIHCLATIRNLNVEELYKQLYRNTKMYYNIE